MHSFVCFLLCTTLVLIESFSPNMCSNLHPLGRKRSLPEREVIAGYASWDRSIIHKEGIPKILESVRCVVRLCVCACTYWRVCVYVFICFADPVKVVCSWTCIHSCIDTFYNQFGCERALLVFNRPGKGCSDWTARHRDTRSTSRNNGGHYRTTACGRA